MIITCLSLAMLLTQSDKQTDPELLVKAPPGWKFERIDFPLPFAPDLPYRGFEELRFAPGMYDTKSDMYFTYTFAMKLETEASIDAAFLASFLERYYRGLCAAVTKGKDFELDLSKVQADVKEDHFESPQSRHFPTLDSFDPFVTGKPLTLHLEILVVQSGANDQRVFAAVSPKSTDDPIWQRLRAFKRAFQSGLPRSIP